MPDYPKMYGLLVLAASEALDALPDTPENAGGRNILQIALYAVEDMYINASDDD